MSDQSVITLEHPDVTWDDVLSLSNHKTVLMSLCRQCKVTVTLTYVYFDPCYHPSNPSGAADEGDSGNNGGSESTTAGIGQGLRCRWVRVRVRVCVGHSHSAPVRRRYSTSDGPDPMCGGGLHLAVAPAAQEAPEQRGQVLIPPAWML